jgi:hypothetical protein
MKLRYKPSKVGKVYKSYRRKGLTIEKARAKAELKAKEPLDSQ